MTATSHSNSSIKTRYLTINTEQEDSIGKVRRFTKSLGADFVFDATGSSQGVKQAMNLVQKGGEVIVLGLPTKPLERFNIAHLVLTEKVLKGSFTHSPQTWNRTISLFTGGKINVKPLISHVLPLEEVVHGFNLVKSREAVKVILKP